MLARSYEVSERIADLAANFSEGPRSLRPCSVGMRYRQRRSTVTLSLPSLTRVALTRWCLPAGASCMDGQAETRKIIDVRPTQWREWAGGN